VRSARATIALVLCLLGAARHARAQTEIDVQTFTPPAGGSAAISIPDPQLPAHGTIDLGITASWARWPLVRRVDCDAASAVDSSCVTGDRDGRTPVVSDLAAADLTAAIALFDAMRLGVVVPLVLVRVADDPERPQRLENRVRVGDLRLATDVPLLAGTTALALSFVATLPTGDGDSLVGARNWTAMPALVARQQLGAAALSAALGYRLRERAQRIGIEHDDELDAALGLTVALPHELGLHAELRARAGLGGETKRANEQPIEAALAASFRAGSTTLQLGAGAGVWPGRRGYGAPIARVFAALRHALLPAPCAFGPEDYDGFRDHDGCRDPDDDADGVADADDACAFDPEDRDGFADADGCPDWDDDADGLPDGRDRCPRRSEDRDGFEDGDGCPEPDNDEDGSADGVDACALDPEDRDGFEDDDGCPEPGPRPVSISVGEERILVSERIYFDDDRDTIRPVSGPVLDQLAEIIATLAPGVMVLVEGHTDDSGNAAYNLDLSHRRARAVVAYLQARGVPADRLDATGHGAARPLAPNDSPEGRALNRRVEFLLVR
jgi:outer membrane protein OmpA-like peptidoglycan-associated protein